MHSLQTENTKVDAYLETAENTELIENLSVNREQKPKTQGLNALYDSELSNKELFPQIKLKEDNTNSNLDQKSYGLDYQKSIEVQSGRDDDDQEKIDFCSLDCPTEMGEEMNIEGFTLHLFNTLFCTLKSVLTMFGLRNAESKSCILNYKVVRRHHFIGLSDLFLVSSFSVILLNVIRTTITLYTTNYIWKIATLFILVVYLLIICTISLYISVYIRSIKFQKLPKEKQLLYKPFQRLDQHQHDIYSSLTGGILILSWKLPLFITILILNICSASLFSLLLTICNSQSVYGRSISWLFSKILFRFISIGLFCLGIYEIREHVPKDEKDTFHKAPKTVISNHISACDILIYLYLLLPSFVAKREIESLPFVGFIAKMVNCIFVARENEEERLEALRALTERQIKIAQNEISTPLVIFPEGTTSNGTYIMPFKRGVFSSLLPLYPAVLKYNSTRSSPALDIIPFSIWLLSCLNNIGFTSVDVFWLPKLHPRLSDDQNSRQQNIDYYSQKARRQMSEIYLSLSPNYRNSKYNLEEMKGSLRIKHLAIQDLIGG